MLRLDDNQDDLFDGWIPESFRELSPELAFVDKALSGPGVLKPFEKDAETTGRPGTVIATYVRMMYLKFRFQISYELLVQEVSDSLKWRRFCHLPLSGKVPDDKTLIKLTARYGEQTVRAIFDAVVQQAVDAKVIRGRKMRLDTTVVESNIHHPTDTGLLADGVRVVTRTVKRLKKVLVFKTRFRDRMRMMKRRLVNLFKFLKGKKDKAKGKLKAAKEEILSIAKAAWAEAMAVLQDLQAGRIRLKDPSGASTGVLSVVALEAQLKHWLALLAQVMAQTRTVLDGNVHIPDRLVSLFDPGARPIQKGKLFPGTEFGRKVLIQEAEKGLVTNYQAEEGNPPDQGFLDPALKKHKKLFGHNPTELAADRGFHASGQDDQLHERGVKFVSIPVRGGKDGHRRRTERGAWFRALQRWRAGGEAKISLLKRKFGCRRTAVRGTASSDIWIGWGLIAHNLLFLSRLGP
jgi:IS5 family transposase